MELRTFESAFGTYGFNFKDANACEACMALAQEFGLSAHKIAFDWDLYASTKEGASKDVSAAQIESKGFRDMLVKQYSNKLQPPKTATKHPRMSEQFQPTPKRQALSTPGTGLKTNLATPASAASNSTHLTPNARPTPATSSKYASRSNRRQVTSTLHDSVPPLDTPASGSVCAIHPLGQLLPPVGSHRYMEEPLKQKVQSMNERVSDWCEALKLAMPAGEVENVERLSVGDAAQDPVWVVGRVILEAGGEGEQCVLLEGGLEGSEGERVRLDLSALTAATHGPACRVFPGQIVAVRGTNPTGECIMAQQLCTHLPAPVPSAPCEQACSMVVAAGPFTPGDELDYTPLDDLLQYCSEKQPDLLVLLGPFVDAKHPSIENGNIDTTFEGLFREEVLQRLTAWSTQHPRTRIALMPSTRDAHHAPVFPTPSFVLPEGVGAAQQRQGGADVSSQPLVSLQNPCTFAAGTSLVVGACTSDALKALAGSEQAKGGSAGQDRIGALASHILGQRSFFPVYPAPLGTCLDLTSAPFLSLPCTPHLLLLVSDLAPFAKVITPQPPKASPQAPPPAPQQPQSPPQQSAQPSPAQEQPQQQQQQPFVASAPARVVCVNPGRIAKGGSGGTFAHVHVQAAGQKEVVDRCRVEVMRI